MSARDSFVKVVEKIPGKEFPHLLPALAAILIIIGLLAGGSLYARQQEQSYVNVLAPARLKQADIGIVLQVAAFRQPDLLPVYSSSEMYNEDDENSAYQFFRTYPTGFTVFEVAVSAITSLEMAQNLAALGPLLKGKKVVISFTPSMFNLTEDAQKPYSGDFSRLHANQMVFSPYLSRELKQRFASRMLDYPNTFTNDPVLAFALQKLASNSPADFLLYNLSVPFGQLQTQIIQLQDHWEVLSWIYSNSKDLLPVHRETYAINWHAEIARAENLQSGITTIDPYGIEDKSWNLHYQHMFGKKVAPGSGDKHFIHKISISKEWQDLDILLSVLKETGAQPLILSRPLNGTMWNAMGVSSAARQVYYDRLKKTVQPYGFPLVDFFDQDTNRLFSIDLSSHTSRLGWVYVDKVLDDFYHGKIH
jgi:D-alanine transfer protein